MTDGSRCLLTVADVPGPGPFLVIGGAVAVSVALSLLVFWLLERRRVRRDWARHAA